MINAQTSLSRYTRLPFGVNTAPGICQKVKESLLQGLTKVNVYIDNILVAGFTDDEKPLKRLDDVLAQLEKAKLHTEKSKCHFMVLSELFLGHRVDSDGLHSLSDKVEAVLKAPAPQNP